MRDPTDATVQASRREPWNKGKLIGAKPPLRPKHVWSIRTKLQIAGRTRDLAMFNLAIDSKLRGCDVVSSRVEDVAPHGHAVDRATVRQKKIRQPVRFEMTEQTREAVDSYVGATSKKPGEFLLGGRTGAFGAAMSSNYNSRLHAPEFLIDGQNSRLIRRRQTFDELLDMEIM
jgi:integrase